MILQTANIGFYCQHFVMRKIDIATLEY